MPLVTGPDPADLKRRAAWAQRRDAKIKARRQHRLTLLTKERVGITRAMQAYSQLDHGQVPWIALRRSFVALDQPRRVALAPDEAPNMSATDERAEELATRPPLTRLVHRESNALALYLTAIFVAHIEIQPGHAFTNGRHNVRSPHGLKAWAWLAGLSTPQDVRSKRARMRRALNELAAAGLVGIKPHSAPHPYEGWTLLREDGSDSPYRRPSERDADAIFLFATFFLRGWHLVLTQGEIAMLLTVLDMSRTPGAQVDEAGNRWISLPRKVRGGTYGISDEIYLHVQQLVEFGLLNFRDPMPQRRRGKISNRPSLLPYPPPDDVPTQLAPLPYQFSFPGWDVVEREAFTVAHTTLSTLSLPHRLDENSTFFDPQSLVKTYQELAKPSK